MKKLMAFMLGATLLAGCSTVAISSDGAMNKGERLLTIQSDGYALVDVIPLCSGTASVDANGKIRRGFSMFEDHARSKELYEVACKYAAAHNCELKNVVFMNNYKGIDTANCYGLLTIYDVSISAVLHEKGVTK